MAKTGAQKVADEAHRYIDSLAMWDVQDSSTLWAMWVNKHGLKGKFARHVRNVVNAILD